MLALLLLLLPAIGFRAAIRALIRPAFRALLFGRCLFWRGALSRSGFGRLDVALALIRARAAPFGAPVIAARALPFALLLARLFARPANVLVLDEPTNDLDIESLELLEQALQDYRGTLLLVSHDRTFLDNVVTQTLAYEGEGRWREYVGGYSDWLRQSGGLRSPAAVDTANPNVASVAVQTASPAAAPRSKLSYKETRELAALPGEIAALEEEQGTLTARMSEADFYREDAQTIRNSQQRIETIEALLMEKLERWEMLEALSSGATTAARNPRPDSS